MPFFVNAAIGVVWVLICFLWFRNFPEEMHRISDKEKEYIKTNRRFNEQQHLIPWKFILKHRTLWALMTCTSVVNGPNYFFVAWMPVYLQEGRHFSENGMKTVTSTLFIVGIIGFLLGGFAGDWIIKKMRLRNARRIVGMTGLGMCGFLILIAAIVPAMILLRAVLLQLMDFFHLVLWFLMLYALTLAATMRALYRCYEFLRTDGSFFLSDHLRKDRTADK
jgi:sugar phosphate permease